MGSGFTVDATWTHVMNSWLWGSKDTVSTLESAAHAHSRVQRSGNEDNPHNQLHSQYAAHVDVTPTIVLRMCEDESEDPHDNWSYVNVNFVYKQILTTI